MKLICYGDSNTFGYDPTDFFGNPYPHPWPDILARRTGWETVNMGMNGLEIPDTPRTIDLMYSQLEAQLPADLLIIMLGTNDILNISIPRALKKTTIRMDNFLDSLRLQFPNLPILLIAPPDIPLDGGMYLPLSMALALQYSKLADAYHTVFLDLTKLPLNIASDGLHLTEEDHETVADAVIDTIRSLLANESV